MFTKPRNSAALRLDQTPSERKAAYDIHLTPRQREVLALLCEGLSNKLICKRLGIALGTVKVHTAVLIREFGVSTRLEVVVLAHNMGLAATDYGGDQNGGLTRVDGLGLAPRAAEQRV